VADTRRIVDVEKEALIVVCEALDALGDGYAVMAFSGEGPASVSVATVKDFSERNGLLVRRRIAALEPDRFTRTGAAIRHATAALSAQTARHRLLLVLSDGKPNDVDVYEGRYGVEDTRQAVAEARMQGLHAFCLTVDRQAPVYLPRIFGPSGYAVLRHAATLPHVLVDVVRLLLRS
jgi:nitric oxide reductase NorD protein